METQFRLTYRTMDFNHETISVTNKQSNLVNQKNARCYNCNTFSVEGEENRILYLFDRKDGHPERRREQKSMKLS